MPLFSLSEASLDAICGENCPLCLLLFARTRNNGDRHPEFKFTNGNKKYTHTPAFVQERSRVVVKAQRASHSNSQGRGTWAIGVNGPLAGKRERPCSASRVVDFGHVTDFVGSPGLHMFPRAVAVVVLSERHRVALSDGPQNGTTNSLSIASKIRFPGRVPATTDVSSNDPLVVTGLAGLGSNALDGSYGLIMEHEL